jgi:hypothetical protein
MTLADVLDLAAAPLDPVERVATPTGVEWRRSGQAFAALAGGRAEFRLPPAVGAAALGTPDTSRSARGADWIAFEPRELERMAVDRASAWLASAWRHTAARPTN